MSPPRPSRAATLLFLGLAVPALAAEREVDGLVIGKTPCAEAIRTIHAQHRERIQASTEAPPAEGSVELNMLRHQLKKPQGDTTPYKVLMAEQSKVDEAYYLEKAAKGHEPRGLNTEECNPFGFMSTYTTPLKALNLADPVQVDVTKLGLKKCPYGSDFISVSAVPGVRLLCLDGVVAVYAKEVPVPLPKLKEELAAKEGTPRDLDIAALASDVNTMTVTLFYTGAAFRHADEAIVLEGYGTSADGPVKLRWKGRDLVHGKMPKALSFNPKSTVFYLSKAAIDTVERDQKHYDALRAKEAARKKKRR
jgi:hypothetical protein